MDKTTKTGVTMFKEIIVQVVTFPPGSQYIHDLTPDLEIRSPSN